MRPGSSRYSVESDRVRARDPTIRLCSLSEVYVNTSYHEFVAECDVSVRRARGLMPLDIG